MKVFRGRFFEGARGEGSFRGNIRERFWGVLVGKIGVVLESFWGIKLGRFRGAENRQNFWGENGVKRCDFLGRFGG